MIIVGLQNVIPCHQLFALYLFQTMVWARLQCEKAVDEALLRCKGTLCLYIHFIGAITKKE